jgi:hypothetical protein
VPSRNISLSVLEQEEAEFKAARDRLLASRQQEAIRRQVKDYRAVVPEPELLNTYGAQSRKLKSRYGARNQFQEPSLEPTWFLAPMAGLKVTDS